MTLKLLMSSSLDIWPKSRTLKTSIYLTKLITCPPSSSNICSKTQPVTQNHKQNNQVPMLISIVKKKWTWNSYSHVPQSTSSHSGPSCIKLLWECPYRQNCPLSVGAKPWTIKWYLHLRPSVIIRQVRTHRDSPKIYNWLKTNILGSTWLKQSRSKINT